LGFRYSGAANTVLENMQVDYFSIVAGNDGFYSNSFDVFLGRRFEIFGYFTLAPNVGVGIAQFDYQTTLIPYGAKQERLHAFNYHYGLDLQLNFIKQRKQRTLLAKTKRNIGSSVGYFRVGVQLHQSELFQYAPELKGQELMVNFGFGGYFRAKKRGVLPPEKRF
jgi:hypothetical protein